MITREDALSLFMSHHPDASLLHHSLETEAVMRGLARALSEEEELWGITGLLHDLDFMETKNKIDIHGLESAKELEGKLPPEAVTAIMAHNSENNGAPPPESRVAYALRCGETVTGLVAANALVRPQGMEGMKPKSLKKKMKVRSFAASVNRDIIMECEKLGLDLGQFLQVAIDAITPIAAQVGLAKP